LPARVKGISFGDYAGKKALAQRETGDESKGLAPETGAGREFCLTVLGKGIPIAGVQEIQCILRGENRRWNSPRLNLRSPALAGPQGAFNCALRRSDSLSRNSGNPNCGGLEVGGELLAVQDMRNRTADTGGPGAEGK